MVMVISLFLAGLLCLFSAGCGKDDQDRNLSMEPKEALLPKNRKLASEGSFSEGIPFPLSGETYEVRGKTYRVLASARGYKEMGEASWYGGRFHGKKTANGEFYDMNSLTAAHKTLPFDTLVKITNLNNSHVVIVRINDRGPFYPEGRIIDLSRTAAEALDLVGTGYAPVILEALDLDPVDEGLAADFHPKKTRMDNYNYLTENETKGDYFEETKKRFKQDIPHQIKQRLKIMDDTATKADNVGG